MDITTVHLQKYVSSIFSYCSVIWVVLSKNFIVPSISQGEPTHLLESVNLNLYLSQIPWTLELGHAFERFSLPAYLDWLDQHNFDNIHFKIDQLPEFVLIYLKDKVSSLCSQNQVSAAASHVDQGQSNLYHHHLLCYQEHLMSSINNSPTRVKLALMSTVWFVLQEPFASLWRSSKLASWEKLCATLFGISAQEFHWDEGLRRSDYKRKRMCHPTEYKYARQPKDYDARQPGNYYADYSNLMYGNLATTKRLIPEPILSLRLAHVVLACIRYLHRQDSNTLLMQHHPLTWAMKSKLSPWLWRRRMRVTSMRCRQPACLHCDRLQYSFPQSLQQSRQVFYSKAIRSEYFYREKETFYIWTLDLLYLTLCEAMKSDDLTKALSKPFIPSVASLLFPRQVKRVREAVEAYLEKVSQRASHLKTPADVPLR
jgi:hypothetical protein